MENSIDVLRYERLVDDNFCGILGPSESPKGFVVMFRKISVLCEISDGLHRGKIET
jgi:hypothetical protein